MKTAVRFSLAMVSTLSCVSDGLSQTPAGTKVRKPQMSDTIKANIYADKFIWSDDIAYDNIVLFRHVVKASPDGKERTDFRNLNNVVPENPRRGPGRGGQGRGGQGGGQPGNNGEKK